MSDRNPPITARLHDVEKVTLVAVIGGFRSDLSMTRKTDGNFGNVSWVFYYPKSCINEKGGKSTEYIHQKVKMCAKE